MKIVRFCTRLKTAWLNTAIKVLGIAMDNKLCFALCLNELCKKVIQKTYAPARV